MHDNMNHKKATQGSAGFLWGGGVVCNLGYVSQD